MKRPLLLTVAALFFAWINVATVLWLRDAGSLGAAFAHLWAAARADWMLAAILTDAGVFVLLALAWLWRNAVARGWSTPQRVALMTAVVVVGSPALLLYLALEAREGRAGTAPA